MIPLRVLEAVVVLFPVSEIALSIFKRSKTPRGQSQDQGSAGLVWIAVALGVVGAVAAQSVPIARPHWPDQIVRPIALVLVLSGLAIRWWAILTLGRFFTVDVATRREQPVVRTGPYRFVRHPSYAGALVAFLGIGVFMSNWLSVVVLLVPIALAVFIRIRIEERALLAALGAPYAHYCARTKRLVPGIL
jgi:protein-S-isoprenylcysteine O-methyltransferase